MSTPTHSNDVAYDDDAIINPSTNPHLSDLIAACVSRRTTLKSGWGATLSAMVGVGAAAPAATAAPPAPRRNPIARAATLTLGFAAVAKNKNDLITVPEGYRVSVVHALGDPLRWGMAPWAGDGSEAPESYDFRVGCGHDGMHFFGADELGRHAPQASEFGALCVNHEYVVAPYCLHPNGRTAGAARVASEVDKEIRAHGVSVAAVRRRQNGSYEVMRGSRLNRRITSATRMKLTGAAAGTERLRTRLSPDARNAFGTNNNCANGHTPWGTYLTCEENYLNVISRAAGDDALRSASENVALTRYGLPAGRVSPYAWDTAGSADTYTRWNSSVTAASTSTTPDFRHIFNTFGWVVEIDPFAPHRRPRKRTAMGRFNHEGAALAPVVTGQPLVWYLGDDARNEYIYKYVSKAVWEPADVGGGYEMGDKYLNDGTLYVARFDADGSGQWMPLRFGTNGLDASNSLYPFADQGDVLTHARLAADSQGATKMDRPEWASVHPHTRDVYMTLTNNSNRIPPHATPTSSSQLKPDAANPRYYEDTYTNPDGSTKVNRGNPNGHIIRWAEQGGQHATAFTWDIYLFGAQADAAPDVNLSALDADNDFSSPDGLAFDSRGLLWIETDDSAYTDETNCMLLAALPGQVGDGAEVLAAGGTPTRRGALASTASLRRFLVGPKDCEITGLAFTPDHKALFVNIQHPGEDGVPDFAASNFSSHWPASQTNPASTARPRSATVCITRTDGKAIAI